MAAIEQADFSSQSPLDLREVRYSTLFRGELPYEPLPDDAQVGISGLCRITHRGGARKQSLLDQLDKIPELITTILEDHDLAAMSHEEEAFYAFIDDETRDQVSEIVAGIFTQWEATHSRHNLGPLLTDTESSSRWLVIETAAAVMEAMTVENAFDLENNKTDFSNIVKIISCWGPKFTRQWFDGTVVREWAKSQALTEDATKEWLSIFTPGMLKLFAVHHLKDPLKALETAKHHLEETLTDQNIAEFLGWTEAEVAELLTPSTRKSFAISNLSDPLRAVETFKDHLETTLADSSLAELLGWSEDEVRTVFTPGLRRRVALGNIGDPKKTITRIREHLETTLSDSSIAEHFGWDVETVRDVFPDHMRKHIALHNIGNPMQAVDRARHHLEVTLTDAKIAQILGWPEEKVARIFVPAVRKTFAVFNIGDPLKACQDWANGKIVINHALDNSRDRKLASGLTGSNV